MRLIDSRVVDLHPGWQQSGVSASICEDKRSINRLLAPRRLLATRIRSRIACWIQQVQIAATASPDTSSFHQNDNLSCVPLKCPCDDLRVRDLYRTIEIIPLHSRQTSLAFDLVPSYRRPRFRDVVRRATILHRSTDRPIGRLIRSTSFELAADPARLSICPGGAALPWISGNACIVVEQSEDAFCSRLGAIPYTDQSAFDAPPDRDGRC